MPDTATDAAEEVLEAARDAATDVEGLLRQVETVLGDELYWYPVRHHSPTIGRRVVEAIEARKPRVVFIEGPSEAQGMIPFVIDPKTKPPIAIYSSFRFEQAPAAAPGEPPIAPRRSSVWYPLVSYSPEYLAMRTAEKIGAEAVFIDLPHFAERPPVDEAQPRVIRRDLDEIAPHSRFYQILSHRAGYQTWEQTWDALFELPRPDQTYESLRREVALFCGAVRATTPRDMLEADRTLARERFMMRTIRQTLSERKLKPSEAMVVCGGFHLFLDQADPTPPPALPDGALSVTVAPYSYFRMSELSGYGAGNRAPRFYEMCFEHHSASLGQDRVVIDYVIDCLKEARKRGEIYSSADAIAATQQALMLARLRGHRAPLLDDIHEALLTCCCKGNPKTDAANLLESIDEVNIGTRLGRVTDRVGRLPIVSDFYEQLDKLDLEELAAREKTMNVNLDKRQPTDAARSAFFHRLVFLGVEIGSVAREASAFGQSIFREHWKVRWSPKIEASLIERSLHGDSIAAASTTLLRESLGPNALEAGPACRRLVGAIDMDLPELIAQAEQGAGHAIDHDQRFGSLADALTSLMLLERYAVYRDLGKQKLADLITRCFDRACFSVPEVASVAPEEWDAVIDGLLALAEPVVQRQDLDADLFASHVQRAAAISTVPFLRGAFLGVLTEMRRMKPEALASELSAYARGGVEQQTVAGDFLHGVLRVSKTAIMLKPTALIAAVDELLRVTDPETFLNMVPRLRAAFETLHERHRDTLASHVAELYGLKDETAVRTLTTSLGAAQLMATLDAQVAKIMKEWMEGK